MVNAVPLSWDYCDEMESLFMFYQVSEELLSFYSPDTYRVSVHNVITLCNELERIYEILSKSNQLQEYYIKYTNPVIDELLYSITQDKVLKNRLGERRESIVTGLTEAKSNSRLLLRWINQIRQSCTIEEYIDSCKNTIIDCVTRNKDKCDLLFYTNSLYVSLLNIGYSVEYLYHQLVFYFDGKGKRISNPNQIEVFLDKFIGELTEVELYLVADTSSIESFSRINPEFGQVVTKVDIDSIEMGSDVSHTLELFLENYHKLEDREKVEIISYKTKALDPYCALKEINSYLVAVQTFDGYFKHKAGQKYCFDVIQHSGKRYFPIKLRKTVPNRPSIDQKVIDQRLRMIIEYHNQSSATFKSIVRALSIHFEAINCRDNGMMLRTFWTATEALFFNPYETAERENVIDSLHRIIEKTYLLKVLRIVYSQLSEVLSADELNRLGILEFPSFVEFFASEAADSEHFKQLTGVLDNNPLLRFRIYHLRKELNDSEGIRRKIEQHNKKINWQILRIYRTRNISTHAGIELQYINDILFNIHNYFDYVINFLLCKIENDEYIPNVSSLVFEAKNDNRIHMELLKRNEKLDKVNYVRLLFGPDKNLIKYEFETNPFCYEKDD